MIGGRVIAGAWSGATSSPEYPATAEDRRTIEIAGLALPWRASVATALVAYILTLVTMAAGSAG